MSTCACGTIEPPLGIYPKVIRVRNIPVLGTLSCVRKVLIDGTVEIWNGLCPLGRHDLDKMLACELTGDSSGTEWWAL